MSRSPFSVLAGASAIALLAAGPVLRADPPAQDDSGYKTVTVDAGGRKVPIRVKQQLNPLRHASADAMADPLDSHKAFSETNAMANKSFMDGVGNTYNKTSGMKLMDAYKSKPYFSDVGSSSPGFGSKAVFRNSSAVYNTQAASGLDKAYPTTTANLGQNPAAVQFAPMGAAEQNRTAVFPGAKPIDKYAALSAQKQFVNTEPDNVKHRLGEIGNGTPLSAIPDRPLTVDEVKNLINHGFKPDTSQPAAAPSKPLNDPDFEPTPLRVDPADADTSAPVPKNARDIDDDAGDVPSPGTMAAPENAEPLPKK